MKNFQPPKMPAAPRSLSAESRKWWRRLIEEYEIGDEAGLLIMETALGALDRMRQAQRLIKRDGAVVRDRFGQQKPHPAILIERDSRSGMLAALRQLNVDIEPLNDRPGRPSGAKFER